MTNSVVENFFAEVLDCSFARMMEDRSGVPTARIEVNFHARARLGEKLDFGLDVAQRETADLGCISHRRPCWRD